MLGTSLNPRFQNVRDYTHSVLEYTLFILGFGYGSVGTKLMGVWFRTNIFVYIVIEGFSNLLNHCSS
jgi:hypothetical protein